MRSLERSQAYYRGNAITGSAKLLEAILRLQSGPRIEVPVFRNKRGRPRKNAPPPPINFEIVNIQFHVAAHYGLTPFALLTEKNKVNERHVAMYLARETGASLPEIGRHFRRDHTTVLSAIRVVAERPRLWTDIVNIKKRIRGPVNNGDNGQTLRKSSVFRGKEQRTNTQEELAA